MYKRQIIPQLDPLQPSTKHDSSTIDENYDGYIDCEAIQEDKNTNKTYAENSIKYDSTGNYVLSKTNRAGFMPVSYTHLIKTNRLFCLQRQYQT